MRDQAKPSKPSPREEGIARVDRALAALTQTLSRRIVEADESDPAPCGGWQALDAPDEFERSLAAQLRARGYQP